MTGKFKTNAEIIKWKYRGKIGAKSENTFKTKNTVTKPSEESEKDLKEKEYMGGQIKIKITAKENFFFSFLKLPGCDQLTYECASKNVFLVLKSKKEAHLNSSYENAVLILRPKCHTIKCEKSIQR